MTLYTKEIDALHCRQPECKVTISYYSTPKKFIALMIKIISGIPTSNTLTKNGQKCPKQATIAKMAIFGPEMVKMI